MPAPTTSRRRLLAGAAALVAGWVFPWPRAACAEVGDDVVTAATFIHGITGSEQDLKAHLLSLAAPTRAEPGCLAYDLYQSPDAPSEFLRLERWSSLADLEAHKAMPHLRASFEKRQREGWTTQITVWKRVPEDRLRRSARVEANR
jgi:quinol monooxygenase YgiN